MDAGRWEHLLHDADVGIRGVGATPGEAFAQAALAMTAVITDPDNVRPLQSIEIECAAPDLESLFVDWLNRLAFEMATRKVRFSRFDVAIDNDFGSPPRRMASRSTTANTSPRPKSKAQPSPRYPSRKTRTMTIAGTPNVCSTFSAWRAVVRKRRSLWI